MDFVQVIVEFQRIVHRQGTTGLRENGTFDTREDIARRRHWFSEFLSTCSILAIKAFWLNSDKNSKTISRLSPWQSTFFLSMSITTTLPLDVTSQKIKLENACRVLELERYIECFHYDNVAQNHPQAVRSEERGFCQQAIPVTRALRTRKLKLNCYAVNGRTKIPRRAWGYPNLSPVIPHSSETD